MNILINGRPCAGKDEIADYLVTRYGYVKISFAEPIYWIAKKIFRMKFKNRKLLQLIGNGARLIYKDIWVKIAYWRANKLIKQGKKVVISDVRRENEYIEGLKRDFTPINVYADFNIRVQRAIKRDGFYPDTSLWENESETGADNFRYICFENNGARFELYKKIDDLLKSDPSFLFKHYKNEIL